MKQYLSLEAQEQMALYRKIQKARKILSLPFCIMRDKFDKTRTNFLCRAENDPVMLYHIRYLVAEDRFTCNCIDYMYKHQYELKYTCKHIIALSLALKNKKRFRNVDPIAVLPNTEIYERQ